MKGNATGTDLQSIIEEFEEQEDSSWLATFSDLCLLLLAFFILLYSMSVVDNKVFHSYVLSIRRALRVTKGGEASFKPMTSDVEGVFLKKAKLLKSLHKHQSKVFSDFNFYYTTKGLEGIVGAHLESGIITLKVPGDVLFPSGRAELSDKGRKVLAEIKEFLIKHPDQKINIKGHTDNIPPSKNSRYDSNWELSSMRAVNVLRFFLDLGISPERMTATGLADLDPMVPNSSAENRAKNRRVEFELQKMVE